MGEVCSGEARLARGHSCRRGRRVDQRCRRVDQRCRNDPSKWTLGAPHAASVVNDSDTVGCGPRVRGPYDRPSGPLFPTRTGVVGEAGRRRMRAKRGVAGCLADGGRRGRGEAWPRPYVCGNTCIPMIVTFVGGRRCCGPSRVWRRGSACSSRLLRQDVLPARNGSSHVRASR